MDQLEMHWQVAVLKIELNQVFQRDKTLWSMLIQTLIQLKFDRSILLETVSSTTMTLARNRYI